jgi:hypothetical protein
MGDLIEQKKIISAEQTEQVIIKALVDCMIKHKGLHETSDAVLDALHNIPAVDAAPVVHGRLIPRKGKWLSYFQCSVCGEKISYPTADGKAYTHYCPNCGAKMDGEGKSK